MTSMSEECAYERDQSLLDGGEYEDGVSLRLAVWLVVRGSMSPRQRARREAALGAHNGEYSLSEHVRSRYETLAASLDHVITAVILVNVIAAVASSNPSIATHVSSQVSLRVLEVPSGVFFGVEYAAKMWSCVEHERYIAEPAAWRARLDFGRRPGPLLDLVTFGAFPLSWILASRSRASSSLVLLRLLRVGRVFMLLRFEGRWSAFETVAAVVTDKAEDLKVVLYIALMLLALSSVLVYTLEAEEQPHKFASVLSAAWWAVNCISTVGYGDVYPITALGKIIASATAFLGLAVASLMGGILSGGFIEQSVVAREQRDRAPPPAQESLAASAVEALEKRVDKLEAKIDEALQLLRVVAADAQTQRLF
mmetsp:Transcript_22254/g.72136  ORF Transcript_22254/g.72136 Transcript_22254/m.72136 type:complete len:367 (+) Transcript_22254:189-1289(+)